MLEEKQTRKDYYRVLGVERNATPEDIRKAFRRLAFEHHPDRNKERGAEERFKEINEAYQVLSDADRRACYDSLGRVNVGEVFGRGFDGFGTSGLGDIFDAFFGATARGKVRVQRGADIRVEAAIKFEEAVFGCDAGVEVQRMEVCSECRGTGCQPGTNPERCVNCGGVGQVQRMERSVFGRFVNVVPCERCQGDGRVVLKPCAACQGGGRVRRNRKLSVAVPAGVDNGCLVRVAGEGDSGVRGGAQGDLYVTVKVLSHPSFQREKGDITCEMALNFAQAALGDRIEVPTLYGPVPVDVRAGVQTGEVVRIKGKGAPGPDGRKGDHLARIRVVTPTGLDERQKRILEKLKESLSRQVSGT